MNPIAGTCCLCLQVRDLQESHLVPKALYRLARAGTRSRNPNPVIVTTKTLRQTSRQAVRRLLCSDCEGRFDRNGENWVLKNCYRGRGRFRLRTLLEQSQPIYAESGFSICSASNPDVNVEQLVYFAVSVFWRASIADWWSSEQRYESIRLGAKFQEELRKFLLGEIGLSENFAVTVILSRLTRPVLAFNFPIQADSTLCILTDCIFPV